jgi:hypothetical protein
MAREKAHFGLSNLRSFKVFGLAHFQPIAEQAWQVAASQVPAPYSRAFAT